MTSSIFLVILSAYLSHRNTADLLDAGKRFDLVNSIIRDNERLLSSLKDLEAGQRGYLLTGNRTHLQPFERAAQLIPVQVDQLRKELLADPQTDRGLQGLVGRLVSLVSEKRAEVEATLMVRDRIGPEASLAIIQTDKGRESMDRIRAICAEISRHGHENLAANSVAVGDRQKRAAWMSLGIAVSLFIFLALAAVTIQQGVRHRDQLITDLDSARQHLHTTLLSIGDGVVATDTDGRITFLNSAACRISGWREEDALGKKVETVLPLRSETTNRPMDHPVHHVLRERRPAPLTNNSVLACADGREIPVEDNAAPIFAASGDLLNGVVLVVRDVTARHVADRAIRKWEHIFQHAGFGMAVLSLGESPTLEQINPAFAEMHGSSEPELRGQPLSTVVAEGAWQDELNGLSAAETDGHLVLESRHRRRNGDHFPTLVDVTVIRDRKGDPVYRAAYYSDITARITAEEELRKNEARFRTLADSLPQLVWTTLPDGTPDYFNSRWEAEIGFNLACTNGEGFLHFIHPEDRERCAAEWNAALELGEVFQTECRLRSPGQNRWYICRAIPVRSADGRIMRWFGSCTDIDEQRRVSDALRASTEELKRSNLDLEQFAFAASHDLQEPLRMVVIYAQLLKEKFGAILQGDGQVYLKFAVDGAIRMEMLLKDLLAYSRAATPADVPFGGVSASAALDQAITSLGLQVEQNGAVISRGDLPRIEVPEIHLVQIFQNLISNALKYRRSDAAPEIGISAAPNGPDCLFSVRDNGIGIDPKYHEHIFRVFRRLHGAEYPGTGIGLALCQRLVELNGGKIWVDSKAGMGATFFFTLPLRRKRYDTDETKIENLPG